ncbi:MAG: DUF2461 domain-containing protein [Bacteroidota bacterium]
MKQTFVPAASFEFLNELARNNNRDWFNKHKNRYVKAQEQVADFADEVLRLMRKHDNLETASGKAGLHRIYKDTRFSKDKTPYKTNWSGNFKRATKQLRGGYYFHLQPGNSFAAGGFFSPSPEDLKRIRQDIEINYEDWRNLLNEPGIAQTFGSFAGEKLTTAPKGFSQEHPAIDLLRHKQFFFRHSFTDEEVTGPGFAEKLDETFQALRPFFDYMSEVLTTDLNGNSL